MFTVLVAIPHWICPRDVPPLIYDLSMGFAQRKPVMFVAHLLFYLLHLMFMALWRKLVICRCPYSQCLGSEALLFQQPPRQYEASPADITSSRPVLLLV